VRKAIKIVLVAATLTVLGIGMAKKSLPVILMGISIGAISNSVKWRPPKST
jgi:hypothetical protein